MIIAYDIYKLDTYYFAIYYCGTNIADIYEIYTTTTSTNNSTDTPAATTTAASPTTTICTCKAAGLPIPLTSSTESTASAIAKACNKTGLITIDLDNEPKDKVATITAASHAPSIDEILNQLKSHHIFIPKMDDTAATTTATATADTAEHTEAADTTATATAADADERTATALKD